VVFYVQNVICRFSLQLFFTHHIGPTS